MSDKHSAPPEDGGAHPRRLRRRFNTADLRGAPAADAFKLPVEWRDATLLLIDGSRHDVRVSIGRDESVADLLDAREPFFPALSSDSFRLYARAALACVTVSASAAPAEDMPIKSRELRVTLASNATLEGRLDFVPLQGRARVTDVLNEPASTFCLHHGESISYVVKAHVLFVEEQAS